MRVADGVAVVPQENRNEQAPYRKNKKEACLHTMTQFVLFLVNPGKFGMERSIPS
jgi:hypothetical protein